MVRTRGAHLEVGRLGEDAVAAALALHGWQILDRNWRCADGELDIVALEGSTLVIVEVKTRSGAGFGTGADAVTWEKYRRLRRLAARWREAHDVAARDVRIDVVSVVLQSGRPRLEHLRGVFR